MDRAAGPVTRAAIVLAVGASFVLGGCTRASDEGTALQPSQATQTPPGRAQTSAPPSAAPTPAPTQPPPTSESPSPTPTPTPASADPVISEIGDRQWARIESTGTWRPECPVGRGDLRRLDVNFVGFDGDVRRGDLVAHRDSVNDLASIFTALFEAGFPIERMRSVERYDGDVNRSLEANNTSAFNCRRPGQINAPVADSPHANGRAIDINPYQNPWTDPRCDCWNPSDDFAEVREGPGVITEESLPWQLFLERGWIWQDIKVPDYMHFDTGFPSLPR